MEKFNIAIDGPAGAGKSTVARLVARSLGFVYVDTGAMYRAVTWKALQLGLDPRDSDSIVRMANGLDIQLIPGEDGQTVLLNGKDVTEEIRSVQVNQNVSAIAAIPEIRSLLVRKQQEMARSKGVVMDGRDIGTKVLPDAEVKIYLTASVRERAARRFEELKPKQPDITIDQLERDIAERDRMDQEREVSPLRRAKDAVLVDTTDMPIEQVVERILDISKAAVGKGW